MEHYQHPLARALKAHHERKQAEHGSDGDRLTRVGDRIKFKAQTAYDCKSRWRKVTATSTTSEGVNITKVTCNGWPGFIVHDYEILEVKRDEVTIYSTDN